MTDADKLESERLLREIERNLKQRKKLAAQIESLASRLRALERSGDELKSQLAEVYTMPLKLE